MTIISSLNQEQLIETHEGMMMEGSGIRDKKSRDLGRDRRGRKCIEIWMGAIVRG